MKTREPLLVQFLLDDKMDLSKIMWLNEPWKWKNPPKFCWETHKKGMRKRLGLD